MGRLIRDPADRPAWGTKAATEPSQQRTRVYNNNKIWTGDDDSDAPSRLDILLNLVGDRDRTASWLVGKWVDAGDSSTATIFNCKCR